MPNPFDDLTDDEIDAYVSPFHTRVERVDVPEPRRVMPRPVPGGRIGLEDVRCTIPRQYVQTALREEQRTNYGIADWPVPERIQAARDALRDAHTEQEMHAARTMLFAAYLDQTRTQSQAPQECESRGETSPSLDSGHLYSAPVNIACEETMPIEEVQYEKLFRVSVGNEGVAPYVRFKLKVYTTYFEICSGENEETFPPVQLHRKRYRVNGQCWYFLHIGEFRRLLELPGFNPGVSRHVYPENRPLTSCSTIRKRLYMMIQECMTIVHAKLEIHPTSIACLDGFTGDYQIISVPENSLRHEERSRIGEETLQLCTRSTSADAPYIIAYITHSMNTDHCASCGELHVSGVMKRFPNSWSPYCPTCFKRIQLEQSASRRKIPEENNPKGIYETTNFRMDYGTNVLDYKKGFITARHVPHVVEEPEPIMLGVELELEHRENYALGARFVHKTMGAYAISKKDATLNCNLGLEIVTVPASLQAHKHIVWKEFFSSKPYEQLRAWYGANCGMHVHISMRYISDLELGKMVKFVNAEENRIFMDLIAGRPPTRYCTRDDKKKIISAVYKVPNHYDALSFSSNTRKTAELRIFRSNISPIGFWKNMEFTHALCMFAKQGSSIQTLTVPAFLAFIQSKDQRSMYPNLIQFLVTRGKIQNRQVEPKRTTLAVPRLHLPKPDLPPITEEDLTDGE